MQKTKIILMGTTLLMASTALAFGGMFGSSGHKSTTYKGGVDAIGVHFGGEKETTDSQPEESGCPAEKQCGDYCCQGDNVCHQDADSGEYQCCSEEWGHCCSSNQSAYYVSGPGWLKCCDGKLYCHIMDFDGNCVSYAYSCCEAGQTIYLHANLSYGYSYHCCAGKVYTKKGIDGADLCCAEGQGLACADYDQSSNCVSYTCCPEGEICGIEEH